MEDKNKIDCIRKEIRTEKAQYPNGALGVVTAYNRYDNTATVIISRPDTDEIDEVINKVPCPVLLGIQSVAPSPGRPCYVIFKGGNKTQPLISHFYNHRFGQYDYNLQSKSHVALPSYLLNS